jgi:hypothetical protein
LTLNITLLTPFAIYQSADFAIRGVTDKSFSRDDSAKIVVLQYRAWSGFVTYTGLGSWQRNYVSDLIANWLDDRINRSMWEVAAVLQNEGASLLDEARDAGEYGGGHTFTLAGFEDNVIRAFVISNFENCYNEGRSTIDDYLTITSREFHTWAGAAVIVTGQKSAVPVVERRILRKLAIINPEDGERIRRQMRKMNAEASASLASATSVGPVSRDCAVISFRFDGYGRLQLGDIQGVGPKQIPIVNHGVYQNKFIAETMAGLGIDMSSARMDSVTIASTYAPGPPSGIQRSACSFPAASTNSSGGYEIREITGVDFEPLYAYDINDVGHVIGTGREEKTVPWTRRIPWLMIDGQVSRLNFLGDAWAINENDQIAAMPQDVGGEEAALYANDSILQFPLYGSDVSAVGATRSTANAINADGIVAGSVCTQTGHNIRTAVFQESHPPIVLTEAAAEWGNRPVDINDRGQVLVLGNFAPPVVRSILWNFEDNSWDFVGDNATNVMPVAVTNDGLVLGVLSGTPTLAVICKPNGAWEELGTDDGFSPTDINDAGDVVGIVMQDHLFYPWLRLATGEQFLLPFVREHHTEPKAINSAGTIVGTAQTDHGGHAVIWRRG